MSKKVKIYLTVFILAVALPLLLSSCIELTEFLAFETCCGSWAFIGAPLLMLKVINKKI